MLQTARVMIPKKLSIAIVSSSLVLASCGGGWDEESKFKMKETCTSMMSEAYSATDAASICECYVSGLVAKYPKADFNQDQNYAEMERCSGGYKSIQEEQLEKSSEEMMRSDAEVPTQKP